MKSHVLLTLVALSKREVLKRVNDDDKYADYEFEGVHYNIANANGILFRAEPTPESLKGLFPLAGTRFVREQRSQNATFEAFILFPDGKGVDTLTDLPNHEWTEVFCDGKRVACVHETPEEIVALADDEHT